VNAAIASAAFVLVLVFVVVFILSDGDE